MPFKKGESGNLSGRPAGQTPAASLKMIIAENMPDILNAMIAQAKQGDVAAGKALLDKVCPSLKPQALSVNIEQGENLAMSGQNILIAALSGNIAPDISAVLLNGLANQAKLEEFTELERRIALLEGQSQ